MSEPNTIPPMTWDEVAQARLRIENAESVTLPRNEFIRYLDFMERLDSIRQIQGGHAMDRERELKAEVQALRAKLEVAQAELESDARHEKYMEADLDAARADAEMLAMTLDRMAAPNYIQGMSWHEVAHALRAHARNALAAYREGK